MKKNLLLLLLFVSISVSSLMAQSDAFFGDYQDYQKDTREGTAVMGIYNGNAHVNPLANETVPVGNGLLVLLFGGMSYVALKNVRKEDQE